MSIAIVLAGVVACLLATSAALGWCVLSAWRHEAPRGDVLSPAIRGHSRHCAAAAGVADAGDGAAASPGRRVLRRAALALVAAGVVVSGPATAVILQRQAHASGGAAVVPTWHDERVAASLAAAPLGRPRTIVGTAQLPLASASASTRRPPGAPAVRPSPPAAATAQQAPGDDDANRDWSLLDPRFRERLLAVFETVRQRHGYEPVLVEGWRSPERQARLAGLGPTRTQAGPNRSRHQAGLAADVAFRRDGRVVVSERDPWVRQAYLHYGEIARESGLEWGGDWSSLKDFGHVEMRIAAPRADGDGERPRQFAAR